MDKIKLTQEQYKYLGALCAAGVLIGMKDLIDEIISALEDDVTSDLWDELYNRVESYYNNSKGIVQFEVEG